MGLPSPEQESLPSLLLDVSVDGRVDFTSSSLVLTMMQSSSCEPFNSNKRNDCDVKITRQNEEAFSSKANMASVAVEGFVPSPSSLECKSPTTSHRLVPVVAGSREWLPALVEAGRQEVLLREKNSKGHAAFDRDDLRDFSQYAGSDAFFIVDLECVLHKYRRWHECFPRVKPFYAIKCNPNPEVVRVLAKLPGCAFDCASPGEMDQVLENNVDSSRIIYANPCKTAAALEHALSAGITTMTFDSKDELYKTRRVLDERAKRRRQVTEEVQMVLRLRVPDTHSDCPLGEKYGAVEGMCSELIALTVELHLPLVGVSFHCGSGCTDAQAYPEALRVARFVFDLAAKQGIALSLLDIGGGFPGWDGSEFVYGAPAENRGRVAIAGDDVGVEKDAIALAAPPLSLADIAEVTVPALDKLFPPSSGVQIIAEPGRYFVEASHVLFSRIYAKRKLHLQPVPPLAPSATMSAGGNVDADIPKATTTTGTTTTAYFTAEGLDGCFKDRILCGVQFEPCALKLSPHPSSQPQVFDGVDGVEGVALDEESNDEAFCKATTGEGVVGPCVGVAPGTGGGTMPTASNGGGFAMEAGTHSGGRYVDRMESPATTFSATDTTVEENDDDDDDDEEEVVVVVGEDEDEDEDEVEERQHSYSGKRLEGGEDEEQYEDAVIMGPSGSPGDVVARKHLPRSLKVGDWLYFSRMGAYTTSIATVASSVALESSFCYVASTSASSQGGGD